MLDTRMIKDWQTEYSLDRRNNLYKTNPVKFEF